MTCRRIFDQPRLFFLICLSGACAVQQRPGDLSPEVNLRPAGQGNGISAIAVQPLPVAQARINTTKVQPCPVGQGKTVNTTTRVLVLGCSVDRNAVEYFCQWQRQNATNRGELPPRILNMSEILQARWCRDQQQRISVASLFHPGVGYNGDLEGPFFFRWAPHGLNNVEYSPSTAEILRSLALPTAKYLLRGSPNLVVVDSSLWDLSAWHTVGTQDYSQERVKKWCYHDLPFLLYNVSRAFPNSTVAFRTAPTFSGPKQVWRYSNLSAQDVADLYHCVQDQTHKGKLYGKYPVVDYRELVQKLKEKGKKDIFMRDGMHPHALPSLLYVNEILKTAGAEPPCVDEDADLAHLFTLEDKQGHHPMIDPGRSEDGVSTAPVIDPGILVGRGRSADSE